MKNITFTDLIKLAGISRDDDLQTFVDKYQECARCSKPWYNFVTITSKEFKIVQSLLDKTNRLDFDLYMFSHSHYPQGTKLNVRLFGNEPPAFTYTTGIKEIKVIGDLKLLGDYHFSRSEDLEVLDLTEAKFEVIAHHCITGTKVKELILPEGVQELAAYVFEGCDYLEFVHFPSTIIEANQLGPMIFNDCPNLKKIEVSENMTDDALDKLLSYVDERDKVEVVRY